MRSQSWETQWTNETVDAMTLPDKFLRGPTRAAIIAERDRYRTALEEIAAHEIEGPVDEWAEAEAYNACKGIARRALTQKD